jgi:hypothetical protein
MDIQWESTLFGAFGIAVIKLIWEAVKFYVSRRDANSVATKKFQLKQKELETLFHDLIAGAVEIQDLMEEFVEENGAARVLIFRLENGGGVPQLGTVQRISVINEAIRSTLRTNGTVRPVKTDLQSFIIDGAYQRALMEMMSTGEYTSTTAAMEPGFLKTLYESENIHQTHKVIIAHIPEIENDKSKGFLLYMVIQLMELQPLTARVRSESHILREKIRNRFQDFYIKRLQILNQR